MLLKPYNLCCDMELFQSLMLSELQTGHCKQFEANLLPVGIILI